jgi:hypothetical protein
VPAGAGSLPRANDVKHSRRQPAPGANAEPVAILGYSDARFGVSHPKGGEWSSDDRADDRDRAGHQPDCRHACRGRVDEWIRSF